MRPFIVFLVFSVLFAQCAGAQKAAAGHTSYITKKTATGKAKKYFDKGMSYLMENQNRKGIAEFEKALKAEPRFIDAQLQWAALHYEEKDYVPAEKGFEKVLQMDPLFSKKVAYVLALTELNLGKSEEAITHLKQFIHSKPQSESLLAKAQKRLETVEFTTKAMANPVPFRPESLGDNVNTRHPEYLPSLTADENTLIYTRRIYGQEDFYMAQKIDGVWQTGQPMEDINTDNNEGAQSITADGKFLVFTKCNSRADGYGSCDIYFSEFKNGRWTSAANIGSPINSRAWESQPSIAADGKTIYFASNRDTGKGKSDIYVSRRSDDGKWSRPVILSDIINTTGDEQSPFIHADGQTLYFMSNGHPGMGGFDLYLSRKQADGNWGKPMNLGYPINTKADESTLVISLDGQTAYYASDRELFPDGTAKKNEKGTGMDLYSFELYAGARPQPVTYVRAIITDAETKKPLMADVDIMDIATGDTHAKMTSDETGAFLITLPVGKDYALNVSKPKYTFHSEHFDLTATNNINNPYELRIELNPMPAPIADNAETPPASLPTYKPIILRNVFFDTGSADLRPASFAELNRLKLFLDDHPNIRIQLGGHTDNVGSDADNMALSNNRAKAVQDYLIAAGIAASRLEYKGFGETKPIDTNDTDAGRQNNRRTEFVILR